MFELEGLSSPEIAASLEIPLGTVASRLRRAREQFRVVVGRTRARHAPRGARVNRVRRPSAESASRRRRHQSGAPSARRRRARAAVRRADESGCSRRWGSRSRPARRRAATAGTAKAAPRPSRPGPRRLPSPGPPSRSACSRWPSPAPWWAFARRPPITRRTGRRPCLAASPRPDARACPGAASRSTRRRARRDAGFGHRVAHHHVAVVATPSELRAEIALVDAARSAVAAERRTSGPWRSSIATRRATRAGRSAPR